MACNCYRIAVGGDCWNVGLRRLVDTVAHAVGLARHCEGHWNGHTDDDDHLQADKLVHHDTAHELLWQWMDDGGPYRAVADKGQPGRVEVGTVAETDFAAMSHR